MIVISRFPGEHNSPAVTVVSDDDSFVDQARQVLTIFARQQGFIRGYLGHTTDRPTQWALVTQWKSVGAYRRALSTYDVKAHTPFWIGMVDEPSVYEIVLTAETEQIHTHSSDVAHP